MPVLRPSLALVVVLLVSLLTAFAIIASTHGSRALYAQLQVLEGQRWYLEEEYSRLLLEQGTWSSHHRIEVEARESLGLAVPSGEQLRLLTR